MSALAVLWEQDPLQGDYLERLYAQDGFNTLQVERFTVLKQILSSHRHQPVLVVLTLGQPATLAQICQLQQGFPLASLLVLSASQELKLSLAALKAGADEYLSKPFQADELIWRSRVLLRRSAAVLASCLRAEGAASLGFGRWRLYPERRQAELDGQRWRLNQREFSLLHYLLSHPGELLSREQLSQALWQGELDPASRQIDNLVLSLRKKLPTGPMFRIETVYAAGYVCERAD